MTRWSWVIDQTKCIGCHACTTACKSENDVAVGVFRTWVKNVDVGYFPEVKRHFAVLRCNHCEDAPCVEICPTTAMYQRPDGLVDFDESICIGCKACMQACPYDAIYMDPDSNTAAKCNFCSHRVDEGLLPACVVVCPVEALVFGDMDDPDSKVSREIAAKKVTVRRPEQHTKPKAFYIGAHPAALDPLGADHEELYMWADKGSDSRSPTPHSPRTMPARVAYDVPRQTTWGWKVSSYIWTKSIAAGAALIPALFQIFGGRTHGLLLSRLAPVVALVFLALTGVLLVADLKRPERFWTILTRPQWRSWLARGAFIITAYGGLLTAWAAASWFGATTWAAILAWPVAIFAMWTAIYTAWLFGQCEGRDLWQGRLLLVQLAVHAPLAGLAMLLVLAPLTGGHPLARTWGPLAAIALGILGMLSLGDIVGRHATANAEAAAHALGRGAQSKLFWTAVAAGTLLPALLILAGPVAIYPLAGLLALGGLWLHGHAFVLAGQGPPIS